MSAEQYTHIEQDTHTSPGGNELPTYDDLASQNGPNSRFGRWRGWIEKRAAERYADTTAEERARRRERGWGNEEEASRNIPSIVSQPPTPNPFGDSLYIQTSRLSVNDSPPGSWDDSDTLSAPLPFVSQTIEPSHLKINHFGSRFLPHTASQIRCVLPLLGDRMLLVGHDEGLSVLDMFPQQWSEDGDILTKGPDEAHCWPIWRGECVYQMCVLEVEENGTGTPQGVVLAIVGPSPESPTVGKEPEVLRTPRMYNLGSLISLARWTIAQKGARPLDLHRMSTWQLPPTPSKKHRQQGSIARSIKSLIDQPHSASEPTSSYQSFLSPTSTVGSNFGRSPPGSIHGEALPRQNSDESGWDVVDDLPLRWATDFVPLAAPGSRLSGAPVVCFATWSDETRKGKGTGGQLLAIATKSNILLYETPKGERAYRFVKEFYTPLQTRNLAFIQQSVNDVTMRNSTESSPGRFHSHKRSDSGGTLKGLINSASASTPLQYGTHLSLFVVFDKKAGIIRLADSAVGEVELGEDGGPQLPSGSGSGSSSGGMLHARDTFSSTVSSTSLRTRARLSFDIRESAARWITPVRCELPVPGHPGLTQAMHVITRGKRTHVVPCPLPSPQRAAASAPTPLHAVFWKVNPRHVSARVIYTDSGTVDQCNPHTDSPLLQLVAFTENGLEVHETGLYFMRGGSKGKGRAMPPDETIRAEEDLGGEVGFLTLGGNWDRLDQIYTMLGVGGPGAGIGSGFPSATSVLSFDSMDSIDILSLMKKEEGMYGWCRKGLEDWRIFWVGGNQSKRGGESSREEY